MTEKKESPPPPPKVQEKSSPESEKNETLLHSPMQPADLHRPVLPKAGEDRKNFFLNRVTFIRMSQGALLLFLACFFFLLINNIRLDKAYPFNNPRIHKLENELRQIYINLEDTKDATKRAELEKGQVATAEKIRKLDLYLRENYFSLIDKLELGALVLFLSGIVALLAFRLSRVYTPIVPAPIVAVGKEERVDEERSLLLKSVAGAVALLLASGIGLSICYAKPDPGSIIKSLLADSNGDDKIKKDQFASLKDFQKNWPFFRGPAGSGAYKGKIPFEWNAKTGKNIAWKSDIPLNGLSSPVVWGDRVFLTGAVKARRELYCYSADNGKKLWSIRVGEKTEKRAPEVFSKALYATPTPVSDGQRVCALYANGDLICADMKGNILWEEDLGLPDNGYGHASSLLIFGKTVIVQWDHNGSSASIFAYHLVTGKRVWRSDRGHNESTWSSPILSSKEYKIKIKGGFYKGRLLLLASPPGLQAYDPGTGDFLWKIKDELSGDFGPSPVLVNEKIIFCANGESSLLAINTDGSKAWENEEVNTSAIPSVASDGKYIWLVTEAAELSCLNFSDGKLVYKKEMEGFNEINASPAIINDKILIMGRKGKCLYIGMGSEFKIISEPVLKKGSRASPSFGKNAMFIRDGKKLICVKEN